MNSFNLKSVKEGLKTNAEWFGLREVYESQNTHIARDGHPEGNYVGTSHGVMVEVLVDGQFGYSATTQLSQTGIQSAMDKAVELAKTAGKYSVVKFNQSVRPKNIGNYKSNAINSIKDISIPEISHLLLSSEKYLKNSERIICTTGFAMMVDSKHKYICIECDRKVESEDQSWKVQCNNCGPGTMVTPHEYPFMKASLRSRG